MKYSILTPAYNAQKYIKRSIDSAINQTTIYDYQIIVCDDGSTDNTLNILSQYNDKKLKIIKNDINQGGIISRKKLLLEAKGEYIIWLDADDQFSNNLLTVLDKQLEEYNYDIIEFSIEKRFANNKSLIIDKTKQVEKFFDENLLKLFFKLRHKVYLWGKCIKRECCIKYLPLDWSYPCDDIFLAMPTFYYAKSYKAIKDVLYTYYYNIGYWSRISGVGYTIDKKTFLTNLEMRKQCYYFNLNFLKLINCHELYYYDMCNFIDFKDLFDKVLRINDVQDRLYCFKQLTNSLNLKYGLNI